MNSVSKIILVLMILSANNMTAQNLLFKDDKDSKSSDVEYFVYAEEELGNFRDALENAEFQSNSLKRTLSIDAKNKMTVIMLRVLRKKGKDDIEKIIIYSVREYDNKFRSEIIISKESNKQDIDLLRKKLNI